MASPTTSQERVSHVFNQLFDICQTANVEFHLPEVIVIGSESCGKSTLLNMICGYNIFPANENVCTLRPYELLCERDSTLTERQWFIGNSTSTALRDAEAAERVLADKTTEPTRDAIRIRVRGPECWNVRLIDLPGLRVNNERQGPDIAKVARDIAVDYLSNNPDDRIIFLVEKFETGFPNSNATKFIAENGGDWANRTVTVFTQLDRSIGEKDLTVKFERANSATFCENIKTFFSYMLPPGQTNEEFRQRIYQSSRETPQDCIGLENIMAHLATLLEERYRACLPRLLTEIPAGRDALRHEIACLEREVSSLSLKGLQEAYTITLSKMAQVACEFIGGGGNMPQLAKSLEEEYNLDPGVRRIIPEGVNLVPEYNMAEQKLMGGSQYERLLRQLELSILGAQPLDLTDDQICNAAYGMNPWTPGPSWETAVHTLIRETSPAVLSVPFEFFGRRLRSITCYVLKCAIDTVKKQRQASGQLDVLVHGVYEKVWGACQQFADESVKELMEFLSRYLEVCAFSVHTWRHPGSAPIPAGQGSFLASLSKATIQRVRQELTLDEDAKPKLFSSTLPPFPENKNDSRSNIDVARHHLFHHFAALRSRFADNLRLIFTASFQQKILKNLPVDAILQRACVQDAELESIRGQKHVDAIAKLTRCRQELLGYERAMATLSTITDAVN
eukprot:GILK01002412.1.p1 GENE.GILK01002412.1~~GILK01002412.1.p1  ORF type:complete len:692 (-),score=64.32 GILK01002412.1:1148-3178(-)